MKSLTSMIVALVGLAPAAAGCSAAQPAPAEPEPTETEALPPPAPEPSLPAAAAGQRPFAGRCLPVVSGCGCAYACGESISRNDDGTVEVVHDFQDSATSTAEVAQWCFDSDGRGSPAVAAAGGHADCFTVYYDRTPCGGECIPSLLYLECAMRAGSCRAVGAGR